MRTIDDLFDEIRRGGVSGPPVSEGEWSVATSALVLPSDLARFYREVGDGAVLEFEDCEFRLAGIGDFRTPEFLPDGLGVSWIEICDVGDGNCVAIDMETVDDAQCNVIDVFHETAGQPGESNVIARSFSEFLDRLLSARGSYWLDPEFSGYGDAFDVDS